MTSYSILHLEVLRSLICWSGLSPGIIKMTGRTLMRVLRYTENVPNAAIEEHREPLKDTVARIMQPRSFQGEDLTTRKRMPAHRKGRFQWLLQGLTPPVWFQHTSFKQHSLHLVLNLQPHSTCHTY